MRRSAAPIVGASCVQLPDREALTSTTQAFLLGPGGTARLTGTPPDPRMPRTLAGLLVNPGLEAVDLTRHGPTWTPATPPAYACLGLKPPDRPVDTTAALPNATDRLHGRELTVQLVDAAWAASTSEPIRAAIRRENGGVLMLTSAINTHQTRVTQPALHRLMRTGDIAIGWVARTDSHVPRPRPRPTGLEPRPTHLPSRSSRVASSAVTAAAVSRVIPGEHDDGVDHSERLGAYPVRVSVSPTHRAVGGRRTDHSAARAAARPCRAAGRSAADPTRSGIARDQMTGERSLAGARRSSTAPSGTPLSVARAPSRARSSTRSRAGPAEITRVAFRPVLIKK